MHAPFHSVCTLQLQRRIIKLYAHRVVSLSQVWCSIYLSDKKAKDEIVPSCCSFCPPYGAGAAMRSPMLATNDDVSSYTSNLDYLRDPSELGLERQLSWEDLGAQWEHNLHELSPQVKKCDGAETVTKRLKDMGVPQVMKGRPCSCVCVHGWIWIYQRDWCIMWCRG